MRVILLNVQIVNGLGATDFEGLKGLTKIGGSIFKGIRM